MRYKQSSKLARKRIVVVLDRPNTILILPSQAVLAFKAEPSDSDVAILQIPGFDGRTLCMVFNHCRPGSRQRYDQWKGD